MTNDEKTFTLPPRGEAHIALLSDIHGDSVALQAVLSDIDSLGGVDEYWVLGDLVATGHDPAGTMNLLMTLPNARFIRGNTDRYTFDAQRTLFTFGDIETESDFLSALSFASSFSWAQGVLTNSGHLPWLSELPLEFRVVLPCGSRVLAVHASPRRDDGGGVHEDLTDEQMSSVLGDIDFDLLLVGHTHDPLDTHFRDTHIINVGSVGSPRLEDEDKRASYGLMTVTSTNYSVTLRRVDYDRQSVIEATKEANHPTADYIIRRY